VPTDRTRNWLGCGLLISVHPAALRSARIRSSDPPHPTEAFRLENLKGSMAS
jgi:hypothetical protein